MATPPLPDAVAQEALDAWAQHHKSHDAASRALGISRNTFQNRLKIAKARGLKPRVRLRADMAPAGPKPESTPLADRERIAFEDTIRDLRRQLRDAHRTDIAAERVRAEIYGFARQEPRVPDWLLNLPAGGSSPGVPITIWSDWHYQEVVNPAQVGGVNRFDKDVAAERIRLLVERIIDVCFNHMVRPEYPGIIVNLGGDMITGTIHAELADTNDIDTMPAMLELEGLLIWALERLIDRFGRVFVVGVVGNHGRTDAKPRAKNTVTRSYEWNIYQHLMRYFRHRHPGADSPITFLIPDEVDAHYSVYGHRYMLTHGDRLGVKGGDGIIGALGPIQRGRIKVGRSEAQIGREFDTMMIGHWHQYLPLPGCIVNGSLKGYCEYARLELRVPYQAPIQALWFHHPKWGQTFHAPIFLDEPRTASAPPLAVWGGGG